MSGAGSTEPPRSRGAGSAGAGANISLLERLRALPALEEAPSQWTGGPAFWLEGREIVHLHDPELLEIRLTRKRIREVLEDERIWQRSRYSDWIVLRQDEVELAVELTWRAIEANHADRDERP